MREWIRARLTYANVMATIAVFLGLGGTALAGSALIDGANLKNRSVAGKKLKKHTVGATEIKLGQLPFQGLCQQGTILGFAAILGADPGFPNTYGTEHVGAGARNCPDKKPVEARRAGTGDYYINFVGNGAELMVGSGIGLNPVTLVWEKVPDPTIGGTRVFHVKTFGSGGISGQQPIDATFSMIVP
jgi:hypothetical protein